MSSLTIIKDDKYIEKAVSDIKENIAELIFLNEDIEIVRYRMPKDLHGVFEALSSKNEVEIYNIISGKMMITPISENKKILTAGDTMVITQSSHCYPFQILEDTIFICTSNNHLFYTKKQQIEELTSIMKKLQEKDGCTKKHCLRVQQLSMKIAHQLNMDDTNLDNLFHAARFHDIGKINIPTNILVKPTSLTNEEKKIINTHPIESYKMIVDIFGEEIGQMVLQHHERINGSGYPQGLKNNEIKLGAKIIAVADSYDALTSSRPYHTALDPQTAINILLKDSGIYFDVDCINALIKCLKKDKLI